MFLIVICFYRYAVPVMLLTGTVALVVSPVQKQPAERRYRRGQEAGSAGSSAQHRLHRPGHRHHRGLHLIYR